MLDRNSLPFLAIGTVADSSSAMPDPLSVRAIVEWWFPVQLNCAELMHASPRVRSL